MYPSTFLHVYLSNYLSIFFHDDICSLRILLGIGVDKGKLVTLGEFDAVGRGKFRTNVTDFIDQVALEKAVHKSLTTPILRAYT